MNIVEKVAASPRSGSRLVPADGPLRVAHEDSYASVRENNDVCHDGVWAIQLDPNSSRPLRKVFIPWGHRKAWARNMLQCEYRFIRGSCQYGC